MRDRPIVCQLKYTYDASKLLPVSSQFADDDHLTAVRIFPDGCLVALLASRAFTHPSP